MRCGLDRRGFLGLAALPAITGATLAATAGATWAATEKRLVFVPQAMPASLDPIATPSFATRTAAMAVFETLYATDVRLNATPQMVDTHRMEDAGKRWVLQLRSGLLFHDGTKVTAQDCVASLRRWMRKDRVGRALAARTDTLEATDAETLTLRLLKPLPLVPNMLTKSQLSPPVIMPVRLAETDADTPVETIIGSGPFRLANPSWKPGDDLDLVRFEGYQPRMDPSSFTSGRRRALVDRVSWRMPRDPIQALREGAADWVEWLPPDMTDNVLSDAGLKAGRLDEIGNYALLRLNTAHGPTANQRVRQAILAGLDQTAVMEAVFGQDRKKFRTPPGLFSPDSDFASSAGGERMGAKKSPRAIKAMLKEAGYKGEPMVILNPLDDIVHNRLTGAVIAELTQIGLTVEERKLDRPAFDAWRRRVADTGRQADGPRSPAPHGAVSDRAVPGRAVPVGAVPAGTVPGGVVPGSAMREGAMPEGAVGDGDAWSGFCESLPGADHSDPFAISAGPAPSGGLWPGWLDDPQATRLRDAWIDTPDLGASRAIAAQLQVQVFTTAIFVPLGQWFPTSAWRPGLTGQQKGSFPVFWEVVRP